MPQKLFTIHKFLVLFYKCWMLIMMEWSLQWKLRNHCKIRKIKKCTQGWTITNFENSHLSHFYLTNFADFVLDICAREETWSCFTCPMNWSPVFQLNISHRKWTITLYTLRFKKFIKISIPMGCMDYGCNLFNVKGNIL